jgi:toxin-antitoxin system PIN domain toxin
MKLLDANVWLAAAWANHVHHAVVRRWLDGEEDEIGFCRITQLAFLRLTTNVAVTGAHALSRREAWNAFDALAGDMRVRFLQEPSGLELLWRAISKRDDRSYKVWTDDYLAAFAQTGNATLVTLDRALETRYPAVSVLTLR